ncbi:FadR/GntR family transcriptional regulator [Agrobacterium vitis]|uniref:FadR/GntR family transcriptional regulator n=1 Tax=Agrobacterium vitis TaxID=373 RepID=UPI0015DAB809|nr:FadR/GntR family transcriptional regulator [Agrobacterium vitis]MCF1452423.1 FadR family transcriptional regulator [Agrobacterium vitis]BCH56157.1 GntR family transcriptional regulator [Agrobacterium vitis]
MIEPGSLLRSLAGRITARNFHSHVINEIGAGVISGRFAVGSILPNDAALMDEFSVSRTVLREALKTLEAKGLVEARPKVGTKIAKKSRWNLYDRQVLAWYLEIQPDDEFLRGLGEVRRSLEPLAASDAASDHTGDQIRLMHYWLRQMEIALDEPQSFSLADFELHRIIAEASSNPFLRALQGVIELSHALAYLPAVRDRKVCDLSSVLQSHRALVTAIERGLAKEAAAAMIGTIEQDYARMS